jgi:hypothetical protein
MSPIGEALLIAPCGMNCGICAAFLRKRNRCPGCRGPEEDKPVTRVICKIKTCDHFHDGNTEFCFQCREYPCNNLKHLDKRYRTRYKISMIENLDQIRESGLDKFVEDEKVRWACGTCGGTICVHKGRCLECGSE